MLKKNNGIMPFTATWMDVEIIILSEVRKRKTYHDTSYMWNLRKNDTSQSQKDKYHMMPLI